MRELPPRPALVDPPPLDRASLDALAPGFRYFNVAGSGPTMPVARRAAEGFGRWLDAIGMFSHVGYAAYEEELAATRADLAAAVGDEGGAGRIALLQSATAALNVAVNGLRLAKGARFVTTDREHASALMPQYARRERGDDVVVLPYDGDDATFLARLRGELRPGGALVVSHVSHRDGMVLPVREASALAHERDCVAIIDGAQALGQVPVNVRAIGCDAYCLLGHKWLHGPLATGALWLRDPVDARFVPTFLGWRAREPGPEEMLKRNAERFESGTVDVAAFFGLRQALAVHRALGIGQVAARVGELRAHLLAGLAALPVKVRGRAGDSTGIVAVQPLRAEVEPLVARMWDERGVVVKTLAADVEPAAIRVSFWYLHEDAAIDDLVRAFAKLGS